MKRLFLLLLAACSILQVAWGQESSQSNTQSPFVGEWIGTFKHLLNYDGVRKETRLILRIEWYGDQLGVRVKLQTIDGQNVEYRDWNIIDASPTAMELTYKNGEYLSDEGYYFWELFHYLLTYEHGRLQLIGKGADECTRKNGRTSCKYNPNMGGDWYDMYLYKNDNW